MAEEFQYPHIGQKIQEYVTAKGFTKTDVGAVIGMSQGNIVYLTKRPSIDVKTLHKISVALKHNFFQYYPVEGEIPDKGKMDEKDTVIVGLKEKIAQMERAAEQQKMQMAAVTRENELMRDVIDLLKKK
jgi:hypothetical protein